MDVAEAEIRRSSGSATTRLDSPCEKDRIASMLQARVLPVDDAELASLCKKFGVVRLSLFGSILRSDFDTAHSDVDVLVEFAPGARKSLFKLLEMEAALSQLFGRKVDLNTAGSLSKYFRDDVLAARRGTL